jgi:ABC-type Fe3+ transport system permease subunit
METTMKKTAKPIIGGILAIASGGLKILALLGLIFISIFVPVGRSWFNSSIISAILLLFISLIVISLAVLAIVGGIYALHRKKFRLAVAGSVAAFLPFSLPGLVAILLIVLSQNEFEQENVREP